MLVVRGNKRKYMSLNQTLNDMRNRTKYEGKAKNNEGHIY